MHQSKRTTKTAIKKSTRPKLTAQQNIYYSEHISMRESLFNVAIKKHCIFIQDFWVYDNVNDENVHTDAVIYGWPGTTIQDNQECICCFFIFWKGKLWSALNLWQIQMIRESIEAYVKRWVFDIKKESIEDKKRAA